MCGSSGRTDRQPNCLHPSLPALTSGLQAVLVVAIVACPMATLLCYRADLTESVVPATRVRVGFRLAVSTCALDRPLSFRFDLISPCLRRRVGVKSVSQRTIYHWLRRRAGRTGSRHFIRRHDCGGRRTSTCCRARVVDGGTEAFTGCCAARIVTSSAKQHGISC